jgi:hypothetical protein
VEQGWDPEVRKFFVKILNTISMGLIWLLAVFTAGLYFGLATHPNIVFALSFYAGFVITLVLLVKYLLRLWRQEKR